MRWAVMLLALVFLAVGIPGVAFAADPTCTVNDRAGFSVTALSLPEGVARTTLSMGTTVEIATMALDTKQCPWALLRDPENLDIFYGWVDRRNISCR